VSGGEPERRELSSSCDDRPMKNRRSHV